MLRLCAFADEASKSIEGQVKALKKNGISLLELRSVDRKNVLDFTDLEIEKYKKYLDENGIKVWSIGSPIGKVDIAENEEEYDKKVDRIIEIAKKFGAENIRMFSFFKAYGQGEEVIRRLQKMVDTARKNGVTLCHENEKEIYGDTLERVLDIANGVKGLKLVYDPANYLQCGINATLARKSVVDYCKYFHIKDYKIKTDSLVPAGYGNGDIEGLLNDIKGLDTVLTLEPHLKLFDGYASIDNTEMKNEFEFNSNEESFEFAVTSLKNLIKKVGYKETEKGFTI